MLYVGFTGNVIAGMGPPFRRIPNTTFNVGGGRRLNTASQAVQRHPGVLAVFYARFMRNEFWSGAKKRDNNTILGKGEKARKKNNHAPGSPQKAPRLRGEECRGRGNRIVACVSRVSYRLPPCFDDPPLSRGPATRKRFPPHRYPRLAELEGNAAPGSSRRRPLFSQEGKKAPEVFQPRHTKQ